MAEIRIGGGKRIQSAENMEIDPENARELRIEIERRHRQKMNRKVKKEREKRNVQVPALTFFGNIVTEYRRDELADELEKMGIFPRIIDVKRGIYVLIFDSIEQTRQQLAKLLASPQFGNFVKPLGPNSQKFQIAVCRECGRSNRVFSNQQNLDQHFAFVHSKEALETIDYCKQMQCQSLYPEELATLSKEIFDLCGSMRTSEDETKRSQFLERISLITKRRFQTSTLLPFGSYVMGLWDKTSDIDLCLYIPGNNVNVVGTLEIIKTLLGDEFDLVSNTRVPVLRLLNDKGLGFTFDLNVNHTNGYFNSMLFRTLIQMDPRALPLAITVRRWAKIFQVSDSRNAFLSSYAILLLVTFYLQSGISPQVLPVLTHPDYIHEAKTTGKVFKLQKCRVGNIEKYWVLPNKKWVSQNEQSVGDILVGFFRFYALEFDFLTLAIQCETGQAIPKVRLSERYRNSSMVVLDPLETTFNTAMKLEQDRFDQVIYEFRFAYQEIFSFDETQSILQALLTSPY